MDSYLEFKDGFRLEIKKASLTLRSKTLEPLQIIEKESLSISSTQSKLLCALERHEQPLVCSEILTIFPGNKVPKSYHAIFLRPSQL